MGELLLGTSSWSEASWAGVFYPQDMPPRDYLGHYARSFRTVEADVTYYRVPERRMVAGWAARTPEDFVLCAKFPRSVVHAGQGPRPDGTRVLVPEHVQQDVELFLEAMGELGDKCGPLELQFPYFNKQAFAERAPFLERLDAFLGGLPAGFRYAVELRNKAWIDGELLALLARHRTALVLVDLNYMPHPAELAERLDLVTTDFAYARLIGDRKAIDARTKSFDRIVIDRADRLRRWAGLLAAITERVTRTYLFANNHYAGHAPETVRQLQEMLAGEAPGQAASETPGQTPGQAPGQAPG